MIGAYLCSFRKHCAQKYRNNSTNPITVNYNVNYSKHKKESELKYSNKLHNLLCRSFMFKGKFKISK